MRILDQPFQSFFAAAENRQVAPGEAFHVFVELAWKAPCPYQGRFLDIGLIEYRGFFHGKEGIPVKRCSGKIRKYEDRAEWLSGYEVRNSPSSFFDFMSRAIR